MQPYSTAASLVRLFSFNSRLGLGYGRVEILTKPGADKFHGTGYYNFGDSVWNSRNPYAAEKAPFLLKEYGGSLQGPLGK
jgi:hypothetical protein